MGVALGDDATLLAAAHAAASAFVVPGIDAVDRFHPRDDSTDGSEALLVESLVVGQIHVQLGGA